MPIAKFDVPGKGIARIEVPEGTTPEQAQVIFEGMIANGTIPTDHDYSAVNTLKNAPGDFVNELGEFYEAVSHPVDTFNNMTDLVAGGVGNLFDIEESADPGFLGIPEGSRAKADALGQHYKGYLDPDTFQRRLEESPFGTAADLLPFMPGKLGKLGAAVDPLNITKNAFKGIGRGIGQTKYPQYMMENAFRTDSSTANFMLEKGYIPTQESFDKFVQDRANVKAQLDEVRQSPGYQMAKNTNERLQKQYDKLKNSGKASPTILKHLQDQMDANAETMRQFEGDIGPEYARYGKASDLFEGRVTAAEQARGNLNLQIGVPSSFTGALAGVSGWAMGLPPAASVLLGLAGGGASVLTGLAARPVPTAKLARSLNNSTNVLPGFMENSVLSTIAQQTIREIGSDEKRYMFEQAGMQ